MDETTQHFTKPKKSREEHGGDSQFMRISIRAWLALVLIGAVVARSMSVAVVVILFAQQGKITPKEAVELLAVTEPLYTMSGMALAYYFGQQKQGTPAADKPPEPKP